MVGSASRTARRGRVTVQTYRGYGSTRRIFLMGRVFREASPELPPGTGFVRNLKSIWRLTRAWGIEDAVLAARFGGIKTSVRTDRDGYFRLVLDLQERPPTDRLWHEVIISLEEPAAIEVAANVFVPSSAPDFVVISDIDDTVMHTGVANKLLMMWRLFVQGAEGRTAIPGMAAFLQALHRGPHGKNANPMLYVSRAPWSIYGVLERFFHLHEIPAGPILFLREWGLTLQHPFPRRSKGHKRDLIRQIIEHYDDLPFILIGDSGQRDPEVYAEIVKSFPKRVLAVYIRDVSRDPMRDQAIGKLGAELEALGSPLLLADDVRIMAQHAVTQELIGAGALDKIAARLDQTADAAG
jgi:phosphatidate phosphatase APP1